MAFLGSLLQPVLLVVLTTVPGLLILPLYRLFCYAVGMESGRRLLLPEVYAAVSASTANLGTAMGIGDVFAAIGALFSGIFADFQYRLAPKLLFLLIAALLCLGAYVAPEDLLHAVSDGVVFAAVVAASRCFAAFRIRAFPVYCSSACVGLA